MYGTHNVWYNVHGAYAPCTIAYDPCMFYHSFVKVWYCVHALVQIWQREQGGSGDSCTGWDVCKSHTRVGAREKRVRVDCGSPLRKTI